MIMIIIIITMIIVIVIVIMILIMIITLLLLLLIIMIILLIINLLRGDGRDPHALPLPGERADEHAAVAPQNQALVADKWGVNTNGVAVKVINFDRLGKKVLVRKIVRF